MRTSARWRSLLRLLLPPVGLSPWSHDPTGAAALILWAEAGALGQPPPGLLVTTRHRRWARAAWRAGLARQEVAERAMLAAGWTLYRPT
jgi:hypothetical protein